MQYFGLAWSILKTTFKGARCNTDHSVHSLDLYQTELIIKHWIFKIHSNVGQYFVVTGPHRLP